MLESHTDLNIQHAKHNNGNNCFLFQVNCQVCCNDWDKSDTI